MSAYFCYNIVMNTPIQKRKKIVQQAIANERLEGLKVSKESQKIASNYIAGKVSAKEAAKKIRARYGVL
jgi:hypothetical protein